MKPIRSYSDGQWLVLLWAFVALFLIAGLFLGIAALVVISLLGAAGAGFTTFVYVRELTGPRGDSPASDADTTDGGQQ
jgi:hypothetical protein